MTLFNSSAVPLKTLIISPLLNIAILQLRGLSVRTLDSLSLKCLHIL